MNGTLSKLVWGFFRGKTETKKKEKLSQCSGVFSEKIGFYPYVFCFWFLLIMTAHNTHGGHIVLSFYKLGPFLITESAVSKKKTTSKVEW